MSHVDVAVVGSGFAGSILARVLARLGLSVALIERGRHPRFALGESSTPLAALALERLARRYDLPDLHALAAWGRWTRTFPHLLRGLKRGFTFYPHRPGEPWAGGPESRLLVAASPSDAISDTHWLRADVDRHLAERAAAEGVDYRDEAELETIELGADGARLAGRRGEHPFTLAARVVIDASGPRGFLATRLPVPTALDRMATDSGLVFSHFEGAKLFAEVAAEAGRSLSSGPYPDDWAALHHVLDAGWMYVLRFDDGLTSAGFLLRGDAGLGTSWLAAEPPEAAWRRLLDRYPTVAAQFRDARPVRPIGAQPRIQHRLAHAAGPGWALLPHAYAFVDPLFSTGIAWSLLGIERLARLFEAGLPGPEDLDRYARLLDAEADRIDRLVRGAYLAMPDFGLFTDWAMLYFATVSFGETRQRLIPNDHADPWTGFLGTGDPVLDPLFAEAGRRLEAIALQPGGGPRPEAARRAFSEWVRAAIEPRNVAGLADPAKGNLYGVDLDDLVRAAPRLGLTREEVVAALPRLRGETPLRPVPAMLQTPPA